MARIHPARLDLKTLDEAQQIAAGFETFGQKVKMIRHKTIGVNGEIASSTFGTECFQQP